MTRLSELPVQTLKIDRSFIKNLSKEDKRYKIVNSTIVLAKGMSIKIIAEGVETVEEETLLLQLGCQMAQGYYYYVPMTARDLEILLLREKSWAKKKSVVSSLPQTIDTREFTILHLEMPAIF